MWIWTSTPTFFFFLEGEDKIYLSFRDRLLVSVCQYNSATGSAHMFSRVIHCRDMVYP